MANMVGAGGRIFSAGSNMPGPAAAALDPDDALARLNDVSVVYETARGRTVALQGASLEVRPREVIALIGPSGCGKSTILRLLCDLAKPSSGRVRTGSRSTAASGGISVMFQTPSLLDWRTVFRNVSLPLETRGVPKEELRERVHATLKLVGISALGDRKPYELSGGQQQRVALARALVTDPDLLLLDEPFAALDAISRDQMCLELDAMCTDRAMSTVLVTHSVSEAILLADRILVMQSGPGRIAEEVAVPYAHPRSLDDRAAPAVKELELHLLKQLAH
jgi:NitT/TauT family transport system ATP-binding protein